MGEINNIIVFVQGEYADADDVNFNFEQLRLGYNDHDARILVLEGSGGGTVNADTLEGLSANAFIQKDGSIAYTANQSMGGFKIINLGVPTNDTDAATKLYVDDAVSGGDSGVSTGDIILRASTSIPTGFLEMDGSGLDTTTYANLFTVLGYTFGGSGSTFNLPDARGEFLRIFDNSRGIDSGRVFGSFQDEAVGPHNHTVPTFNTSPGVDKYFTFGTDSFGVQAGISTNTSGSGIGTETRPRNIALSAFIKY